MSESGEILHSAGIDASEPSLSEDRRLQLEARLSQIHKMEALGSLAGGIAHDFNNLLTVIIGCTELAILDAHEPKEVVGHLARVLKASERAKELVHQILMFTSKQKQERKPLRLQPVIKESLEFMRHSLPVAIEIVAQVDADAPMVLADPTQMHQVMINLFTNAAHAMRERSGRLTVALKNCSAEDLLAKDIPRLAGCPHVQLSVCDTGHGMDANTVARIFEPFFTTKKSGEGTGLGLSVVQGIVHEHQGAITVRSQPEVGTTLKIYLPVVSGVHMQRDARTKPLPRGKGEHILLVDDESTVGASTHVLLNRLGYRVTSKTDSVEALNAFRESPHAYDLLITDQHMPRMSGMDLVHQILAIRPSLPAILTSGSQPSMPVQMQPDLVCDLLAKPVCMITLATMVRKALDVRRRD